MVKNPFDRRVCGRREQGPVEIAVTFPEFSRGRIVGHCLKPRQRTSDGFYIVLGHSRHGAPPDFDLNNPTQIIDVGEVAQVYASGNSRSTRRYLDEAFRL